MAGKNTVLGLDIGGFCARAVWAEMRGNKPFVTRTEMMRLPAGSTDSTQAIKPWVEKLKLENHPCVIAVSGQSCMFQPFLLPPNDPRTPEQAAAMEVIQFNEMASDAMSYAFQPFSFNAGEKRLLLAMTRPAILDQALESARRLELDVIDVVPSPAALFNAGEAVLPSHGEPYMYVDIGNSSTSVAVGADCGLIFARAFAGGGNLFTEALALSEDISIGQAENFKTRKASLSGETGGETLVAAADMWISELQSCFSVYQSVFGERKTRIQKIVFAGGGALLGGFPEYVGKKLGIETVLLKDFPGMESLHNGAGFAVAAGLSAAGLGCETASLSLLPANVRNELHFRKQKPFWIASAVTVAAILGVCLYAGSRQLKRMHKHLRQQQAALDEHALLANQIEAIKANSEHIREMALPVKKLLRAGPLARDLTTLVLDSTAPGDWITMICDSRFYFDLPDHKDTTFELRPGMRDPRRKQRKQDKTESEQERFQELIIEGYTCSRNLESVRKLIAKLRATPYVETADLLPDDKIADEGEILGKRRNPNAQRFVIEARMAAP